MKIGIISDTHNNTANLKAAVERFKKDGIQIVIHCGDLTNPEELDWLDGFQVIFTYGNGDYDPDEIHRRLIAANPASTAAYKYEGEFDSLFIGVTHGHLENFLDEMASSNKFDFIFRGHSHHRKEELVGRTHMINPGALGGLFHEERSYCILDTGTRQVEFVML